MSDSFKHFFDVSFMSHVVVMSVIIVWTKKKSTYKANIVVYLPSV